MQGYARMYRIMIVKSKKEKYESLYQYLTTTVDGVTSPLEFNNVEDLDKQVEKMLNEEGYSKADFIIVKVVDYSLDASGYTGIDDSIVEDNSLSE